ncbi:circadian clock protein KaiC [Lutimaribacter sp. EGI FJ00014]|nr:circadian clock protein KaiC [Lutimaribacter sp. EGI FJ00014]
MTAGGLPVGRASLIEGGAGSGKTVFALQTLVNSARDHQLPGIFVAFEEASPQILANCKQFAWAEGDLQRHGVSFVDAQPSVDLVQSGDFDIAGLLAIVEAKARGSGARHIVFDAIDIVLSLMRDSATMRREIYRLHNWLLEHEFTTLITSKLHDGHLGGQALPAFDALQFMADCAIRLDHRVYDGVSQRNLRVRKYRGSGFEQNPTPMVIDRNGIDVAFSRPDRNHRVPVTTERVSSGVAALDSMMGGGYFRGASILVTGSPGTAKTTLCGAFADAACTRDEPTLFVSFDSRPDEIVRNLSSVGIDLGQHLKSGLLRLESMRALEGNAETHLMRIRQSAEAHGARCVVIDPLSALSKAGNRGMAPSVAERLIDSAKAQGQTVLCTSLLADTSDIAEGTPLQISTIADTWIHLSYLVLGGERNRALSIIKSRGTSHSNQVREMHLDANGIRLSEVYSAGGDVLMGTLRWERERADEIAERERRENSERAQERLDAEAREIEAQIEVLQRRLSATQTAHKTQEFNEAERSRRDRTTRRKTAAQRGGSAIEDSDPDGS